MSARVRINRFLAAAGLCSRRKCEELIKKGAVFVNGERVENLNVTVDPVADSVTVHGKVVRWDRETVVLALNKPAGVISTVTDSHGRKTVIDLAREKGYSERLYPVGRLDLDTSGILIITNDGDLAYRLTHPRFKIEKTYRVTVEGKMSAGEITEIAAGIRKGDFVTQPCRIKVLKSRKNNTDLELTLKEGRKRQIKRMCAHFGHKVLTLHRMALGDLEFRDLGEGEIRPLTSYEEKRLRELTGLV